MKRSTRLLALLLCIVMMATLLPTLALAEEAVTVVDNTGVGKEVFTLSKDRYSVNVNPTFIDTGYGYETTYMFPRTDKSSVKTFTITRNAVDYNRWWRWAKDGDVLNQRQSNDESGYSSHNGTPGVDGWTAKIKWTNGWGNDKEKTIIKDGSRSKQFIVSKPFLIPQPWCFLWNGGYTDYAAHVEVSIERCKPLGTSSILWSANGTQPTQITAYSAISGISDNNQRVYYGDLGQNHMIIVEPRTVTYKLDGGNVDGNMNSRQYVVWTTGTASTSQKHKVVSTVPTKEGMLFNGWSCTELGKVVPAGSDLNNGITKDMTLVAQWIPNVDDPDYKVHFNGNGATAGTMQDQGFKLDIPQNLRNNQFVQQYTVTYDTAGGEGIEKSVTANSAMLGWSTEAGKQPVKYTDGQEVMNLVSERTNPIAVVDLYAQWQPETIILPTPGREVTDDESEDNITGWVFNGWYDGDTFVGMGGDAYTVNGDVTLTAEWEKVTGTKFYIYHSATGRTEVCDVADYATVGMYKDSVADDDGKHHDVNKPFVTKYNSSLDLTTKVTNGYLYGGTFASEADATRLTGAAPTVANFNGTKWTIKTKTISGYIDWDKSSSSTVTGDAKHVYPEIGQTYYIHEVTNEHLQPLNLCTYDSLGGGMYDVDKLFLITAVDRVMYQEAGFIVDGNKVVGMNNTAYDKIAVNFGVSTISMSYAQLNPLAKTVKESKAVCYEVTDFKNSDSHTMQPYWITLDGVQVTGTNTRTFKYNGIGTAQANKQLTISDSAAMYVIAKPAKSVFSAPMMLKSLYSMGQESAPASITDIVKVNVTDGADVYTVEAYNNSILGLVEPAGQDGKLFAGWYSDAAFTVPADLENVADGDCVYAKYVSDSFLQVKYSFLLLGKSLSLTSAVDNGDYAETGYVISTDKGDKTVAVSDYANRFGLQSASKLFGVANAQLMNTEFKLSDFSKGDNVTITPYWVTADGTTVYGTARTLTFTGISMKG